MFKTQEVYKPYYLVVSFIYMECLYVMTYIKGVIKVDERISNNITLPKSIWKKIAIIMIRTEHRNRSEVISCIFENLPEEELVKICSK